MAGSALDNNENLALYLSKAYSAVGVVLTPFENTESSGTIRNLGVNVTSTHRQGLQGFCTQGLWCKEEALRTRESLLRWKKKFIMKDITVHSLVSAGITRLISTDNTDEKQLLRDIMAGRKEACITKSELERVSKNDVGIFALSYRHQGPKGANITPLLWTNALAAARAVSLCAGFQSFCLWVDSVSSISKGDPNNLDYVDWFTVGIPPYLLLPTIILASEHDRVRRMWLRLEEKLANFGQCSVYALCNNNNVVRLEPGAMEDRSAQDCLWCLCQSVVRGEYNNLEVTYRKDCLNLFEWAMQYEKNQTYLKGLQEVFKHNNSDSSRLELPIEKGCHILFKSETNLGLLISLRGRAGILELLTETNQLSSFTEDWKLVQKEFDSVKGMLVTTKNRKKIRMVQFSSPESQAYIQRKRWRSYAFSSLLVLEVVSSGWFHRCRHSIGRILISGSNMDNLDIFACNNLNGYALDNLPGATRKLLGVDRTTVHSEERMNGANLLSFINS